MNKIKRLNMRQLIKLSKKFYQDDFVSYVVLNNNIFMRWDYLEEILEKCKNETFVLDTAHENELMCSCEDMQKYLNKFFR